MTHQSTHPTSFFWSLLINSCFENNLCVFSLQKGNHPLYFTTWQYIGYLHNDEKVKSQAESICTFKIRFPTLNIILKAFYPPIMFFEEMVWSFLNKHDWNKKKKTRGRKQRMKRSPYCNIYLICMMLMKLLLTQYVPIPTLTYFINKLGWTYSVWIICSMFCMTHKFHIVNMFHMVPCFKILCSAWSTCSTFRTCSIM